MSHMLRNRSVISHHGSPWAPGKELVYYSTAAWTGLSLQSQPKIVLDSASRNQTLEISPLTGEISEEWNQYLYTRIEIKMDFSLGHNLTR